MNIVSFVFKNIGHFYGIMKGPWIRTWDERDLPGRRMDSRRIPGRRQGKVQKRITKPNPP